MDQVVLYALLLTLKAVPVPLPLLNEHQMATRCSLKNVASYSPVRLMYGRKTNQSNLPIVRIIVRCALWSVKCDTAAYGV